MDKKSKLITGVKIKFNDETRLFFSEQEKHIIIKDYLSSGKSKSEIWLKYTGQEMEHGHLLRWMRKLGYETKNAIKKTNLAPNSADMPRKIYEKNIDLESFENLQLKKRIDELEKQLKEAEMKALAFSTMIDIAERELKISIKKKYNTKPSRR